MELNRKLCSPRVVLGSVQGFWSTRKPLRSGQNPAHNSCTNNGGATFHFAQLVTSQISEQDFVETSWRTMAEKGRWKTMFGSYIGA
jgi:hypothetical protein